MIEPENTINRSENLSSITEEITRTDSLLGGQAVPNQIQQAT